MNKQNKIKNNKKKMKEAPRPSDIDKIDAICVRYSGSNRVKSTIHNKQKRTFA